LRPAGLLHLRLLGLADRRAGPGRPAPHSPTRFTAAARSGAAPLAGPSPSDGARASQAGSIAVEHITQDPQQAERAALVEYYLGDIRPGASLGRFLAACRDLSSIRDREWRRIVAAEGGGLRNL